jgi:predicted ATPase
MAGLTTFFGREAELAALVDAIAAHRLVTVTGPGGVGKSRLVAEAESRFDEMFDDGVRAVSVAELTADPEPLTVSGRLGMRSPEAVAVSLGDAPALLVLDGCDQSADTVGRFVARVLATSDTARVVVTSREPLGIEGEHLLPVAPLPVPSLPDVDPAAAPAVALFFDRAHAAGATWDPSDETVAIVVELCRRVDALPLAIELAAARARSLSPLDLLALMDRRLDLLRARHPDRAAGPGSVRAAIDVSADLLDPATRAAFVALGVFAGSFDVDLANAVVPGGGDRLATVDLLDGLVDRSLVVAEPSATTTRYRLLELVREYARDELHATERWDEVQGRLTAAMVAEADAIVAEGLRRWSGEVLTRVATAVDNLVGAIDWCIEHDADPARAFRLVLPLFGAVHQTRSGEVRAAGARVFARWPGDTAPLRAEALAIVATGCAMASEHDRATELATEALSDPDATGVGRVLARRALVLAAVGRDDVEAGLAEARIGQADAELAAMPPFRRELVGFEASLLERRGDADAGAELATRLVSESDVAHDAITEIWARLVRANIAARAARWDDVRTEVKSARTTASAAGTSWWRATIFRSEALLAAYDAVACALTDGWDASRPLWEQAIAGAAERGELADLAVSLRAASKVAARLGRDELATVLRNAVPATNELVILPAVVPDGPSGAIPGSRPSTSAVRDAVLAITAEPHQDASTHGIAPADADTPPTGQLWRDGDTWTVGFRGTTARVRNLKGLADLALLVASPGTEVHCLEVMGASDVGGAARAGLDDRARREYQARIRELQEEVDDARAADDLGRIERAEDELDALLAQLSGALGLGGRTRTGGAAAERARSAATFRIRTAIRKVGEVHPDLGRHLTNSVRTGLWCSYLPEQPVTWALRPAGDG